MDHREKARRQIEALAAKKSADQRVGLMVTLILAALLFGAVSLLTRSHPEPKEAHVKKEAPAEPERSRTRQPRTAGAWNSRRSFNGTCAAWALAACHAAG